MKIISIVGARPQFIKLAPIVRAVNNTPQKLVHKILHTGQHYDANMSANFFSELGLPTPDYNLEVGSGSHAEQTGRSLEGIEKILKSEKPDHVIIFGDTNATLAGALAASKENIPLSHIEAGLRSYNRIMPEEINRIISDKLATYLFCPDEISVQNLAKEGITRGVFKVGDVMVDQAQYVSRNVNRQAPAQQHIFMTLHRQETTDNFETVLPILAELNNIADNMPIIFPLHPRVAAMVKKLDLKFGKNFKLVDPLGYTDTIWHLKHARCVVTDSGGLQKEAYLLKTPCITLRTETEWTNTLEHGWNSVVAFDQLKFRAAYNQAAVFDKNASHPDYYGNGSAAQQIIDCIVNK